MMPDGLHSWPIEAFEWARLLAFLLALGGWSWLKGRLG